MLQGHSKTSTLNHRCQHSASTTQQAFLGRRSYQQPKPEYIQPPTLKTYPVHCGHESEPHPEPLELKPWTLNSETIKTIDVNIEL